MVREISRKDGPFHVGEHEYRNLYFAILHRDAPIAHLHIQMCGHIGYLHLYVGKFGAEVLKEIRRDFETIKRLLKEMGVTILAGTREHECAAKWRKFIRLLGFVKVCDTEIGGMKCSLATMEI